MMQKIIALMLCEHALGTPPSTREVDPEFVRKALVKGHFWAISEKYDGFREHLSEKVADEAKNILEMWRVLVYSYEQLSQDEKTQVLSNAKPLGGAVRFQGFDDREEEVNHLAVARFLVDDLGRFEGLKGSDLKHHSGQCLDSYRRMLPKFNSLVDDGRSYPLSKDDIIELLLSQYHPGAREGNESRG